MVPTEITAGELASILGVSERRVAALKAEGRIPTNQVGKVLLHELLARQHAELARVRQQPPMARKLARGESWHDLYPADAMAQAAISTMAHLLPACVDQAALRAGISVEQARSLHAVMLSAAMDLRNQTSEFLGLLSDPDAPELNEVREMVSPD